MEKILLDPPRAYSNKSGKWSHLVCNDIKVLHAFAEKIGLNKCWFQNKKGKSQPHYDLRESLYNSAIQNGAIQVSRRELLLFLKTHFS